MSVATWRLIPYPFSLVPLFWAEGPITIKPSAKPESYRTFFVHVCCLGPNVSTAIKPKAKADGKSGTRQVKPGADYNANSKGL